MYYYGYQGGYGYNGYPCCQQNYYNPCCGGGSGYGYGGGFGYGAAIILVLFILLVIVIGSRLVG